MVFVIIVIVVINYGYELLRIIMNLAVIGWRASRVSLVSMARTYKPPTAAMGATRLAHGGEQMLATTALIGRSLETTRAEH